MRICQPMMGVWPKVDLGEAAEASQGGPSPREMSQLFPILEVEQDSQNTSSTTIYTPPLLQLDTVSPHSCVALGTQTDNMQQIDISLQQPITSAVILHCIRTSRQRPSNNNKLTQKQPRTQASSFPGLHTNKLS